MAKVGKIGVIIYHKNILDIYSKSWVDKCIDSIMEQTHKDFHIYELCYSEDKQMLFSGFNYKHIPMRNHIEGMNYVLDWAFGDGCEIVFNINLDDHYCNTRFEKQIKAINQGYDLVSSNIQYIEERDGLDVHGQVFEFAKLNIHEEFNKKNNIIAHPACCYSKKFWETNKYYNTESLGFEDMELWVKALNNGSKIHIIDEVLLYYRISAKQTGRLNKAQ